MAGKRADLSPLADGARASEAGASLYLLGSGGPEAAVTPPVVGVFADDTVYVYDGSAKGGAQFPIGGNVVAGLRATIVADFATVVWVPSTDFAGGTLMFGGALPIGDPLVDVSAVVTGPRGRSFGLSRSDHALKIGDPILTAELGWRQGLTFNGVNRDTQYRTGTEFHLEGSVEKILSPGWSLGAQAYWFDQLTGDSGAGASLGPFKGQVVGVGGTVAHSFKIGPLPATLRVRVMTEFDAKNRLQGTSGWLDFSIPLWVRLPKAPRA